MQFQMRQERQLCRHLRERRGCQANHTDISRIKLRIFARRFPKRFSVVAASGRNKQSKTESPLVGRWGKAPYPKMLRHLFLEMFSLNLTVPLRCYWVRRRGLLQPHRRSGSDTARSPHPSGAAPGGKSRWNRRYRPGRSSPRRYRPSRRGP